MPKLDLDKIPIRSGTGYPANYSGEVAGRTSKRLGDAGGLTQFGANLIMLEPGAWASHRHWHESEDEFVMIVSGELVMVEDDGETIMRGGDFATHKAGVANGHHLVNRSDAPASFLVIGTRGGAERAHYPDIDLVYAHDKDGYSFTRKDGTPY